MWIVIGLFFIIVGLIYTKTYEFVKGLSYKEQNIKRNPSNYAPTRDTFKYLKDPEAYVRAQREWDLYNERRFYYIDLIEKEKKKYNIKDPNPCGYEMYGWSVRGYGSLSYYSILNDEKFKWIFDEMKKEGVSIAFRPGKDYIDYGILTGGWVSRTEQIVTLHESWLTYVAKDSVHMDYKPFWQDYLTGSGEYSFEAIQKRELAQAKATRKTEVEAIEKMIRK